MVSHHTIRLDVFSVGSDTLGFYAALQILANEVAGSLRCHTIAVDGKTLRRSHNGANGKSALHSISAWACGLRMRIGLNSGDDESDEIPAAQGLIRLLDLQGAVVTADAMHCQTETAKALVSKDADYILTVKGNLCRFGRSLVFSRCVILL
jgi:hypothetical protein